MVEQTMGSYETNNSKGSTWIKMAKKVHTIHIVLSLTLSIFLILIAYYLWAEVKSNEGIESLPVFLTIVSIFLGIPIILIFTGAIISFLFLFGKGRLKVTSVKAATFADIGLLLYIGLFFYTYLNQSGNDRFSYLTSYFSLLGDTSSIFFGLFIVLDIFMIIGFVRGRNELKTVMATSISRKLEGRSMNTQFSIQRYEQLSKQKQVLKSLACLLYIIISVPFSSSVIYIIVVAISSYEVFGAGINMLPLFFIFLIPLIPAFLFLIGAFLSLLFLRGKVPMNRMSTTSIFLSDITLLIGASVIFILYSTDWISETKIEDGIFGYDIFFAGIVLLTWLIASIATIFLIVGFVKSRKALKVVELEKTNE